MIGPRARKYEEGTSFWFDHFRFLEILFRYLLSLHILLLDFELLEVLGDHVAMRIPKPWLQMFF